MPKTTKKTDRIFMSAAELPLQARLRVEYAGRWIAWSADSKTFVVIKMRSVFLVVLGMASGPPLYSNR